MHVTEIDKRAWVREFSFLQEVSHSDWVIVLSFLNDSLNFLEVSEASTALNVLEVDLLVIRVREHIAEEVEEALICAKLF